MNTSHDDGEPVMQPRCVYCKREQYAFNVLAISLGNAPCGHCRRTPPVFTTPDAYRDALRQTHDEGWFE